MIRFVILGEPASKANSRKIVTLNGRPASIKSAKARAFAESAFPQIPREARQRLDMPVRVTLRIWYRTERPDLDESVVLDVLQDQYEKKLCAGLPGGGFQQDRLLVQCGVYRNDRQVREKHVFHGIDRKNPRVEVAVEPIEVAQ